MTSTNDTAPADERDESPERRSSSGGVADWMKALREVAPYLDLGWRLAGTAAFPPLLGYAGDAWLDTLPWGTLIGAAVGLVSAGVQLRRLQTELDR